MLHFILTLILSSAFAFPQAERSIGALYSITNDPRGSSVIINSIGSDGKLTYAGSVPTGGKGLYGLFARGPGGPGALFSQGSVVVDGNHLFVVNPGSNTVTMFSIDPTDPLKIKMVGKPVSSVGEYPVSVAVSPKTVCVLNGGKVNGLYCFTVDSENGMNPHGVFYNFGLNNTTPPVGPSETVSHILFSEDGTKLRASVKGILPATAGSPPLGEGFIATWDVARNGSLSPTYTKTILSRGDGLLPFGMSNIPNAPNALFVADPAIGVTIYNFTEPVATFKPLAIEGQAATCWVTYSRSTDSYWLSDANANKVYEVSVDGNTLNPTLKSTIPLMTSENPIDNVVVSIGGDDYLYVLSPAALSFNVFSLKNSTAEFIQTYHFGSRAGGVNITPVNTAGAAAYVV